ncbi:restriction endonuclease subunit S [Streptomyces sp. NPDC019531]|uniref:restriction endonuclease subunit S n=1 Tax=Streptomyces sp. NPDC019531 TaxID=3365062 RepID=UPI00384CB28A
MTNPVHKPLGQLLLRPPRYGINAAAVPLAPGVATYVRITDINDSGRFSPDPKVGVDHVSAVNYRLSAGELVFARTGASVGKSYLYDSRDGELVYAGFLINIAPDPKRLNPKYLSLFVQSKEYWDWIARTSVRSGQPGVNGREYAQLPVPLPDIATQNAIVSAMNDVDDLLSTLERLIAKKQAIKHGMVQCLLTGKVRLPGFTSGTWETRPLREGVSLISGTHVMARDCNTRGIGTPYLTGPADFPNGEIKQTKFTTRPVSLCRAGDILITVKGSGSGSMVEADAEYCISRQLMAVRTSKWDSRFLFYSLLHNASQIRAASAGLIPGLSRSDILDQQLPIPPTMAEQNAIAEALSAIDHQIEGLKRLNAQKEAIKTGMIQQLLTGRTRLPTKESAA